MGMDLWGDDDAFWSYKIPKPQKKPTAKKKVVKAKAVKEKKPKKLLSKTERFLKTCRMRWVKLSHPDTGNTRDGIVCAVTKLNGVKCLILGSEPTIEYVAMRNIVAVGPKFEVEPPPNEKQSKCDNKFCTDCGYKPSLFKQVDFQ